jgi:hypothetical protein
MRRFFMLSRFGTITLVDTTLVCSEANPHSVSTLALVQEVLSEEKYALPME